MKAYSLETGLNQSTNSIRVVVFAVIVTAVLFLGMSISHLGDIEQTEDVALAKIELFMPPPPPPPKPEIVETVEISQVPIQVDVTLNPDPAKLTVSPIETSIDAPSKITDKIEVNLTDFQRPNIEVNLESIVFEKSEVDQIPARNYSPMPTLPPKLKKEVGNARIIVQLSIDENGRPIHVMVLNSPVEEARPFIIRDLKRWRFRPAKKNGQKVKCWVRFVLVYQKSSSSPFSL